ncbi:MAG: hypothetical protein A4E55_01830 [Pelotomaculum sp. PtaU1.Bin035]|nr:MAG: hypothetical protein A4E55_01830 [Pelotomaculum sp. PtaU1.Bin035]
MKPLIIVGALFLLAWLFIYYRYFRENKEKDVYANSNDKGLENTVFYINEEINESLIYSVAVWGDDNNTGSLASPWKTLQHAVNHLQPGGKLLIREGSYKEYVSLKRSGTSENPIIVGVFQNEEAVLDGEGVGSKYGFNFEFGVSFVSLSGLKVKNFKKYGVALWGENRSIVINNVEVQGCGTGLHIISAVNLVIENCSLYNNKGPGMVVSPGPLDNARIAYTRSSHNESPENPDGFVLDSGKDIMIEKCVAEYNAGSGFSCSSTDTVISACIMRDNSYYGVKCLGEGCKLVNCVIDNNGMAGFAIQGGGTYDLSNNLIVSCGLKGDYGLEANPQFYTAPIRVLLINNIFAYNYEGVHFGSSALLEKEDYNIYWSREDAEIYMDSRKYSRGEINERVWYKETGRGEHSFCRDPRFVDLSCRDYRLAKNSPAIDRGAKEGVPGADINGSVRPLGGGIDIGPYELAEGSLVPPVARITDTPAYSSNSSNSLEFSVKWEGFIYIEGGEVAGYNVQFKDGAGGTWQNWLEETTEVEGVFCGISGHTFYFRVRAKDNLGNWGNWSDSRYTVVPIDDQSPLIKYEGNWQFINSEESYINTLSYSASPGAAVSFRFTGTEAAWISTIGPDRGQALVYLDDVSQNIVDLYCETYRYRRSVFSSCLDGRPHTIRIVVAGTKNERSSGCRVDFDAIAVKS